MNIRFHTNQAIRERPCECCYYCDTRISIFNRPCWLLYDSRWRNATVYSFICFSCLSICRVALPRSFLVSAAERFLTRRRTARKTSKQKSADEKGGRLIVQRGASGYFFLFGNNSPAILFFFLKFECWTRAVPFGNYKFNEARPTVFKMTLSS